MVQLKIIPFNSNPRTSIYYSDNSLKLFENTSTIVIHQYLEPSLKYIFYKMKNTVSLPRRQRSYTEKKWQFKFYSLNILKLATCFISKNVLNSGLIFLIKFENFQCISMLKHESIRKIRFFNTEVLPVEYIIMELSVYINCLSFPMISYVIHRTNASMHPLKLNEHTVVLISTYEGCNITKIIFYI